jgi:hypothetical protein
MKKPEIPEKQPKNKRNTGLTLYPLQFEEAVKTLLNIKPQKADLKSIKSESR